MHHDQAGSTRLITGSSGTVEGKCTYSAYGTPTCEGTATTPLGYDGQYTNSDTGLIYLRAREYDPATGQFLSVDPLVAATRAPYTYAGDNPLNNEDPTGLAWQGCVGGTVSLGFFSLGLSDERWIWLGLTEGMDHDGDSRSDRSGGDDRIYDYRYR